ncbi:MAG: hypothetical protein H8D42_04810 [Candidatus Marinimicrobia bacterium]|nr:hypothetical protein [Candidatus Neomarinimicrobiota bacterium]
MGKKKAKKRIDPKSKKQPRVDQSLEKPFDRTPVWQISTIDVDGPWGWKNIEKTYFFDEIIRKIKDFEKMFWKEIIGRNSHEVRVSEISGDAFKRLSELKLDDIETLVSLRLNGENRLWGIRVENIFKVLWWDPNHDVFPSFKKHT